MNTKDTVAALKELENTDCEQAHVRADELLLEFLEDNGCVEIVRAYRKLETSVGGFEYA